MKKAALLLFVLGGLIALCMGAVLYPSASSSGGSFTNGTFAGDGSGLTNVSQVVFTNFVSGRIYTNSSGKFQDIHGTAAIVVAAVSGNATLGLAVSTQTFPFWTTNDIASLPTAAGSVAGTYYISLNTTVTNGQVYTFTNTSSGAGNSASPAALNGSSGSVVSHP